MKRSKISLAVFPQLSIVFTFIHFSNPLPSCVLQEGMLITLSLVAGLAGVTGAASLTRYFCELFGNGYAGRLTKSRLRKADIGLERNDSVDIPLSLAGDAQLIRGLLDDAEITLRVLRRERPGPSRR